MWIVKVALGLPGLEKRLCRRPGVEGATPGCPDFASPTRGLHNRHRDINRQAREKNGNRAYIPIIPAISSSGTEIAFGAGTALLRLAQEVHCMDWNDAQVTPRRCCSSKVIQRSCRVCHRPQNSLEQLFSHVDC
jgi:hypothetical protein